MIVAMSISVTVTVVQQLSIVSMFSLDWPEPVKTLMKIVRLLSFDVEVVRAGCVSTVTAFGVFMAKLFVLSITLATYIRVHIMFVIVRYAWKFRARMFVLIGGVGQLTKFCARPNELKM